MNLTIHAQLAIVSCPDENYENPKIRDVRSKVGIYVDIDGMQL